MALELTAAGASEGAMWIPYSWMWAVLFCIFCSGIAAACEGCGGLVEPSDDPTAVLHPSGCDCLHPAYYAVCNPPGATSRAQQYTCKVCPDVDIATCYGSIVDLADETCYKDGDCGDGFTCDSPGYPTEGHCIPPVAVAELIR